MAGRRWRRWQGGGRGGYREEVAGRWERGLHALLGSHSASQTLGLPWELALSLTTMYLGKYNPVFKTRVFVNGFVLSDHPSVALRPPPWILKRSGIQTSVSYK